MREALYIDSLDCFTIDEQLLVGPSVGSENGKNSFLLYFFSSSFGGKSPE